MREEQFTPNEYVATCTMWKIACISKEDTTTNGHSVQHTGICTNAAIQRITGSSGSYKMVELKTTAAGNDSLPCTIIDPTNLTLDYIKQKKLIKWTTSATYDKGKSNETTVTWHHEGYPVPFNAS